MNKERPILFNTEMVRAIISDRKTITRRPMNPQPVCTELWCSWGNEWSTAKDIDEPEVIDEWLCPFGQIGDRLYVRETWRIFDAYEECGCNGDCNCRLHNGEVLYYESIGDQEGIKWKPSIHMPKKYSRIWLEITDIKVERIHDISEENAQKEGFEYEGWRPTYNDPDSGGDGTEILPTENFFKTWEKIYGKENLWVWVIEFKRVEK